MTDFYKVDEHGTFPLGLVGDQNPKVQFKLTVYVIDVMFSQSNGVVQHVLELGQDVGDFSDDHGEGRGAPVGAGRDVGPISQQHIGTVGVLIEGR